MTEARTTERARPVSSTPLARLWRVKQVAELIGLSGPATYALGRAGVIPRVKASRRAVRFDPDVLRNWLRAGGAARIAGPSTPTRLDDSAAEG